VNELSADFISEPDKITRHSCSYFPISVVFLG